MLYDSTVVSEEDKAKGRNSHYVYVSKKLPDADEISAKHYKECI